MGRRLNSNVRRPWMNSSKTREKRMQAIDRILRVRIAAAFGLVSVVLAFAVRDTEHLIFLYVVWGLLFPAFWIGEALGMMGTIFGIIASVFVVQFSVAYAVLSLIQIRVRKSVEGNDSK